MLTSQPASQPASQRCPQGLVSDSLTSPGTSWCRGLRWAPIIGLLGRLGLLGRWAVRAARPRPRPGPRAAMAWTSFGPQANGLANVWRSCRVAGCRLQAAGQVGEPRSGSGSSGDPWSLTHPGPSTPWRPDPGRSCHRWLAGWLASGALLACCHQSCVKGNPARGSAPGA